MGDGAATGLSGRLPRAVGRAIFGADVEGYQSARLGYPPELYAAVRDRCGGAARSILEIGPGTGLATRDLLEHLNAERLVAVEADPVLAAHLASTVPDPRLKICQAGFLDAEIAGQFDLACCAAAFHWLEPDPAYRHWRPLCRRGHTAAEQHRPATIRGQQGTLFAGCRIPPGCNRGCRFRRLRTAHLPQGTRAHHAGYPRALRQLFLCPRAGRGRTQTPARPHCGTGRAPVRWPSAQRHHDGALPCCERAKLTASDEMAADSGRA